MYESSGAKNRGNCWTQLLCHSINIPDIWRVFLIRCICDLSRKKDIAVVTRLKTKRRLNADYTLLASSICVFRVYIDSRISKLQVRIPETAQILQENQITKSKLKSDFILNPCINFFHWSSFALYTTLEQF